MKLNELEKKILLRIYELDTYGSKKLILKDTIADNFTDNISSVRDFLEKLEENGYIKTPPKSFCFHFTNEGIDYCKQFFI